MKEDVKQTQVECVGCHFTGSQTEIEQSHTSTQNEWVTQAIEEGKLSARLPQTTFIYRSRMTYPNSPLSSGCHGWPSDGPLGSQIPIPNLNLKIEGCVLKGRSTCGV